MTTVTEAKQSEMKAATELAKAQKAVADAEAALAKAYEVRRTFIPLPDSEESSNRQALALDSAILRAKCGVADAGHALRRAKEAATEARERTARLAPHAPVLDKLDKALAVVKAKDAAIADAGADFYRHVADLIAELRAAILAADALWASLPADVRALDLSHPYTAALFGRVAPESPGLLAMLETVLASRGPLPNSAEARSLLRAVSTK